MAKRPPLSAVIRPADFALGALVDAVRPAPAREFRVPVRRPDDLLVFDLLVDNLALHTDGRARLERTDPNAAAYLIVEFPPQSFGEEAFLAVATQAEPEAGEEGPEVTTDPNYPARNERQSAEPLPPLPSARVRMAGRSRLAFLMPASVTDLPFSLAAVLAAMRAWPLSLPLGALPDPDPPPRFFERADVSLGGFLEAAVAATSWKTTTLGLLDALDGLAGSGVHEDVEAAGARVGARAAGGLTRAGCSGVGQLMSKEIDREVDDLFRRHPALSNGPAHQAAIAAVALSAMAALAPAARRADLDLGLLSDIPFLRLFLAPHAPARTATALELPYRLLVCPIEEARWQHQDAPVVHNGRTELWHTRMTTGLDDFGPDRPGKIRAMWSPDYTRDNASLYGVLQPPPKPFRMSLDPLDRAMLVRLMAGWDEAGDEGRPYTPRASRAARLQLSALGGLLDAEGNWQAQPAGVDLEQWRHLTTLGRDHDVRVVYAGFLCPFGHAASLVKVTERKFESLQGNPQQRIAVLRQRFFIVVRERVRRYAGGDHVFDGRTFPFDEVEILTRATPDLFEPGVGASALKAASGAPAHQIYVGGVTRRMAFWPMVPTAPGTGADFRFEVVATGIDGRRASFSLPLLFVGKNANQHAARTAAVRAAYNAETPARRSGDLGGVTLAYAPAAPGDLADTLLPTSRMVFGAGETRRHSVRVPNFYPETAEASIGVPALQKMLGRAEVIDVKYPDAYTRHGFAAANNPGKVFLQVSTQPYRLQFGGGPAQAKSDTLGALATPQMGILGLSTLMGPVAGQVPADANDIGAKLGNVIANRFDPTDFFPKEATLLGGIRLSDILTMVTGLAGAEVPKLVSRELPAPRRVEAAFRWETGVTTSDPLKLLVPGAGGATRLAMDSLVTTPLEHPDQATYKATASLTHFKVNLFGFIILWFDRLSFDAQKGRKPDVSVALHPTDSVVFGGPLEFVNTLRDIIPSNGFSDPPSLSVTPSGIAASYSLNLPALQVGVFALSNASLGAGFSLPFDGTPVSVRFNFSERQRPFSLTVSLLGGGGFFAIGISSRGVQEIEAALEFGAAIAIDLGVASGGVEIKAGVYFHWLEAVPGKGVVELAGYVRIHGELSVLGLISASITFNLQLSYRKEAPRSSVWGEATLVIEVEVLFFSADVSVRCRKEFGGAKSDPKFIDLIPDAATWAEYCDAFASEVA